MCLEAGLSLEKIPDVFFAHTHRLNLETILEKQVIHRNRLCSGANVTPFLGCDDFFLHIRANLWILTIDDEEEIS